MSVFDNLLTCIQVEDEAEIADPQQALLAVIRGNPLGRLQPAPQRSQPCP
jgi:hypothetical protein